MLSSLFGLFFVFFSCCFFVRFWVVLGGHFGSFLEAKSRQNACCFLFFFRVVFLFVFGSFRGAFWELFGCQNRDKMRLCDFLIFIVFP